MTNRIVHLIARNVSKTIAQYNDNKIMNAFTNNNKIDSPNNNNPYTQTQFYIHACTVVRDRIGTIIIKNIYKTYEPPRGYISAYVCVPLKLYFNFFTSLLHCVVHVYSFIDDSDMYDRARHTPMHNCRYLSVILARLLSL